MTFIMARMGSTRLPGKVLLPVLGKSMIEHLMDRVATARLAQGLVMCTSTDPRNDVLVKIAHARGIGCFRGSEEDVLERFLGAARAYDVDFFVVAEGDDIFCDPAYMDRVVQRYLDTGADFVKCEGLPIGTKPHGVRTEALQDVCLRKTEERTDTAWSLYFSDTGQYRVETVQAQPGDDEPGLRLTLDYPEDAELVTRIYEELHQPDTIFSLAQVLNLVRRKPELKEINGGLVDTYWANYESKSVRPVLRDRS